MRLLASLVLFTLVEGCQARPALPPNAATALEGAETFELLSLDPHPPSELPSDAFHRWRVLGSTKVTETAVRAALITALKQGVAENDGAVASCFNPRHGIRVTTKGVTTDFVICFECLQVEMYSGSASSGFLTTALPQAEFDKVLKAAGVPLARPAH